VAPRSIRQWEYAALSQDQLGDCALPFEIALHRRFAWSEPDSQVSAITGSGFANCDPFGSLFGVRQAASRQRVPHS